MNNKKRSKRPQEIKKLQEMQESKVEDKEREVYSLFSYQIKEIVRAIQNHLEHINEWVTLLNIPPPSPKIVTFFMRLTDFGQLLAETTKDPIEYLDRLSKEIHNKGRN